MEQVSFVNGEEGRVIIHGEELRVSGVEGLTEHLRKIQFALTIMVATLLYVTIASWNDASALREELRELMQFLAVIESIPTSSATVTNEEQRSQSRNSLRNINERFLIDRRAALRKQLVTMSGVENILEENIDILLFFRPMVRSSKIDPKQPLSTIRRDIEALEVIVSVAWPQNEGLVSRQSIRLEIDPPDIQRLVAKAKRVRIAEKSDNSPEGTTHIAETFWLQLAEKTERIGSSSRFGERFPRVDSAMNRFGFLAPEQAVLRLEAESSSAITSRRAKVFDLEIDGRDVVLVLSITIGLALLYCIAYLHQLRLLCDISLSRDESFVVAATWIATHRGRLYLLGLASFLVAPLAVAFGQYRVSGVTVYGVIITALIVALSFLAVVKLSAVRKALGV
jgi:hypothetical protein